MVQGAPWVRTKENEAARLAVERVRGCLRSGSRRRSINPLFLHGPSGTGKSRLVASLADQAISDDPGRSIAVLPASELVTDEAPPVARHIDLVVLEDVQRLPVRGSRALTILLDEALAHGTQVVCTATAGPALLPRLPARLSSRLAGGLVVGIEPFGPESRRAFLAATAAHQGLAVPGETLDWLAASLPGSARALEGALVRLRDDASLGAAKQAMQEDSEAHRASVESIALRVGKYYRVDPASLRSRSRTRQALVPRQVGMYLARRLTALPLEQIGAYFGGRDHSTVLHACRKVEQALASDAPLSQAVRELSAGLS